MYCTNRQWTVISIYYGSYFRQTENAYRLTVRILDMDSQVSRTQEANLATVLTFLLLLPQYASQVTGAPAAILGPAVVQAAEMSKAVSIARFCREGTENPIVSTQMQP